MVFSYCLGVERERKQAPGVCSYKDTNPIMSIPPSWPHTPEGHILKYNQKLGVRISVNEFGGSKCNSVHSTEFSRQISPDCWMKAVSSLCLDSKKPVTAAGVCVLVTLSCVWLFVPMDCNLPGSSVQGVLQSRILEWVVGPFSRGSSQLRDWTLVSHVAGRFLTIWATREETSHCSQGMPQTDELAFCPQQIEITVA